MASTIGDFEQRILFALIHLGADAYGVSIRDEIEGRTGRAVSAGALYTALDRLEKRGLVSSRLGDPTPERGGKRKRLYSVEPAGERALAQRLRIASPDGQRTQVATEDSEGVDAARSHPPRFADVLLRAVLPTHDAEAIAGDLEEGFRAAATRAGAWRAGWWYRRQVASIAYALTFGRAFHTAIPHERGRPWPLSARTLLTRSDRCASSRDSPRPPC